MVGHEPFEGHEEEGSEAAFFLVGGGKVILFDDLLEKALDEVFGIVRAVAEAADIGIKGIPIGAAKGLQGGASTLRIVSTRGEDSAPVSRGEPFAVRHAD